MLRKSGVLYGCDFCVTLYNYITPTGDFNNKNVSVHFVLCSSNWIRLTILCWAHSAATLYLNFLYMFDFGGCFLN